MAYPLIARRHFQRSAELIQRARAGWTSPEDVLETWAEWFKAENPAFNAEKWVRECLKTPASPSPITPKPLLVVPPGPAFVAVRVGFPTDKALAEPDRECWKWEKDRKAHVCQHCGWEQPCLGEHIDGNKCREGILEHLVSCHPEVTRPQTQVGYPSFREELEKVYKKTPTPVAVPPDPASPSEPAPKVEYIVGDDLVLF